MKWRRGREIEGGVRLGQGGLMSKGARRTRVGERVAAVRCTWGRRDHDAAAIHRRRSARGALKGSEDGGGNTLGRRCNMEIVASRVFNCVRVVDTKGLFHLDELVEHVVNTQI
jgi:hypothetical protein